MKLLVQNNYLHSDIGQYPCAIGREGLTKNKIEGDLKTPVGKFRFKKIYYRADKLGKIIFNIPSQIILKDDGWCDDPKSKFYNQSNIKIGKYSLDLNSRKIFLKNKDLDLTERETNLIVFINEKKNVTIKDLQKNVWDYSPNLETHTVETHIYRLRKKMNEIFGDQNFIVNTHNGYTID